jgi:hypothetical protein
MTSVGIVGLEHLQSYISGLLSMSATGLSSDRPQPITDDDHKTVFASMPFRPEYDDVYWVAMRAAAEAIGATCIRVDRTDFDGEIPSKIREYIDSSIAVIADLSGSNPDVLYEVGYARRQHRPCIQICSTPLESLPFNVRNINTLAYRIGETYKLRGPLITRLRAVIDGE